MTPARILVIALAFAVGGCSRHAIVFSTSTRLGIEINPTEGGRQQAAVGFKRFEGVGMPVRDDEKTRDEAYSVYSLYDFSSGSLILTGGTTTSTLHQVFATGSAAVKASSSGAGLAAFGLTGIKACMPLEESDDVAAELTALVDDTTAQAGALAALDESLNESKGFADASEAIDAIELNRCTPAGVERLRAAKAALAK